MAELRRLPIPGQYALDVRGYTCPYPQYYTVKALHHILEGESLEVLLDNHPSLGILQDTAKKRGCAVISVEKVEGDAWRILIRK